MANIDAFKAGEVGLARTAFTRNTIAAGLSEAINAASFGQVRFAEVPTQGFSAGSNVVLLSGAYTSNAVTTSLVTEGYNSDSWGYVKFASIPTQAFKSGVFSSVKAGAFTLNGAVSGSSGSPRPSSGQLYPRGIR